jgi:hypothetical protein
MNGSYKLARLAIPAILITIRRNCGVYRMDS